MTDDNSGWGSDFDSGGNVIGEVPDNESNSIIKNHPGKLIAVWALWFSLAIFGNQPGLSPGVVTGTGALSFVGAFAIVYGYVRVRG